MSAPALRPSDRGPARVTAPGLYGAVEGDFGRVIAIAQSHRLQPRAVLHVEGGQVSLSPEAAAVLIEALARFVADAGGCVMGNELQNIVALARIVLQVDGIPGRENTAQHVVSVDDMHASVTVPTQPGDPWRVEISEAGSEIVAGEGATYEDAVADLRAKVERIADAVLVAVSSAREQLRGVRRPVKRTGTVRITTADINDAMEKAKGNVSLAARHLGCSQRSMFRWLPMIAAGHDIDTAHRKIPDAMVTAAIREAGGRQSVAAGRLGMSQSTLTNKLKVRPHIWPEGVPRLGRLGRPLDQGDA